MAFMSLLMDRTNLCVDRSGHIYNIFYLFNLLFDQVNMFENKFSFAVMTWPMT